MARTPASPSTPLVSAAGTGGEEVAALRAALAEIVADPALPALRDALLIEDFVQLPDDAYAAVTALETGAAAQGYPRLA